MFTCKISARRAACPLGWVAAFKAAGGCWNNVHYLRALSKNVEQLTEIGLAKQKETVHEKPTHGLITF